MKEKPRVKGGRSGVRDWIHSHICSDSKADRLQEELRDARTGLSPKQTEGWHLGSRGLRRGSCGPQSPLLSGQGLSKPFSTHS